MRYGINHHSLISLVSIAESRHTIHGLSPSVKREPPEYANWKSLTRPIMCRAPGVFVKYSLIPDTKGSDLLHRQLSILMCNMPAVRKFRSARRHEWLLGKMWFSDFYVLWMAQFDKGRPLFFCWNFKVSYLWLLFAIWLCYRVFVEFLIVRWRIVKL